MVMRRLFPLLALVVVLMLGVARSPFALTVHAQDATPSGGPPQEEEGVTFTPLGFAAGITLPSPADLIAVRFDLESGAVSVFDDTDPTGGMLIVDSGALTIRVDEQDWTISRGAALQQAMSGSGEDMSGIFEAVAMGDEGTLEVGDVAFIPGSVNGEVRNDGQEPAGGIIFLVAQPPRPRPNKSPAPTYRPEGGPGR
jgi:hypothetical protein